MSTNNDNLNSDGNEIISPDGSVSPELEDGSESISEKSPNYSISKNSIPSFKKILVADDGKD